MIDVSIISKIVSRKTEGEKIGKAPSTPGSFLDKSIWDSIFELKADSVGNKYLFGKLPLVTQYGITMFSNGGNVDIPSIAQGLPFDNKTIWYNPSTNQIEVIGGTGGGGEGGVSYFWDLNGIPSWITNSKPKYTYSEIEGTPDLSGYATEIWVNTRIDSLINGAPAAYDTLKEIADVLQGNVNSIGDIITALGTKWTQDNTKIANWDTAYSWGNHANAGYALKSYVDTELTKYVTLDGEQTISGKKNFTTGGLFINGSQIIYDSTKKYWKLEGDLLVTGGITMYGDSVSGGSAGATTLGQLQNVGNWADSVADVDRIMYQAAGSSNWVAKSLSSIGGGGVSGDYLPLSGGTITNDTDRYQLCLENNGTGETALWFNNAFNYSKGGAVIQHSKNNKGLYITNFSAYVENTNRLCSLQFPVDGGLKITNASGTIAYDILHANNYSSYALPLTGGEIKNGNSLTPLYLDTTGDEIGIGLKINYVLKGWVGYSSNRGTCLYSYGSRDYFGIKDDGSLYYSKAIIWHSNNDGSGSGLDADLLDGKHNGELTAKYLNVLDTRDTNPKPNEVEPRGITAWFNNIHKPVAVDWFSGITVCGWANSYEVWQLSSSSGSYSTDHSNKLFFRKGKGDSWNDWKQIAFTDSNVASATKLQTARIIWGQWFDGSGNVNGDLNMYTSKIFWHNDNVNYYIGCPSTTTAARLEYMAYGGHAFLGGNVGIGTTSPAEKLDVNGVVKCNAVYTTRITDLADTWNDGTNNRPWYGYDRKHNTGVYSTIISDYLGMTLRTAYAMLVLTKDGNIGIGTTSPYFKLDIKGQSRFLSAQNSSITNETCSIIVGTNLATINGYNSGIGFRALTDYNTAYINHNHAWIGLSSYASSASAELYNLVFATNGSTTANTYPIERMRIMHNGYVAIGTTYAEYKLHVHNGDIATNQYIRVIAWTGYGSGSCNMWYDGTNTRLDMSSGLKVASNILAGGGITMYSDKRKKTILNHVELSLKQIANAPLIEHYYNSDINKTTHVGSIAQYWASMNDWFCKLDNEGFYTMEIQNCALASAISIARELDRYESKTDKTIKQLKKRICQLEEEVERLKSA